MSDSLRPHESQHARPPCPSPTPDSISYYSFKIALIFYAPFDLNSAMFKLIELTSVDEVLRDFESSMTSKEIVITEKSLSPN